MSGWTQSPTEPESRHPASFRDPSSWVLPGEDRILRVLRGPGAHSWKAARDSGLLDLLVGQGILVEHWETASGDDEIVVESRRVPFVSYPYEWSFEMLRDGALLTLELTARCLEAGFWLKDASSYNVTFDGTRPVFIDIASIEDGRPAAWDAYAQFCDHFLAPLLLEAHLGVPFQPILRGHLEGIPIAHLSPMLRGRRFAAGVFRHVVLRSLAERRGSRLDTEARRALREIAVLPKRVMLRQLSGLEKLIRSLRSSASSVWEDYSDTCIYEEEQTNLKVEFVQRAARRCRSKTLAWDVGSNTGSYADLLTEHFSHVVAMDNDGRSIDALYARARSAVKPSNLLPMVVDITDPSPSRGWRGRERESLLGRGRPDLSLWLALVHHLCLGRSIPLDEVVALLAETSDEAVIEFVGPEDPMAVKICATRDIFHPGYDLGNFETLLGRKFETVARMPLSPTRGLFHVRRAEPFVERDR